MTRRQEQGFTLLEVLVALAIIAFAMGAIIRGAGATTSNALYLKEKTLAHWVAMNKVAEFQISGSFPSVGIKKGEYEMANRDWRWEAKMSSTEDEDVMRLDVSVYREASDENALALIVAYIGKPQS